MPALQQQALKYARRWFRQLGRKTFAFQEEAWHAYLNGDHGLIYAPTGTGKTMAAFCGSLIEWLAENENEFRDLRQDSKGTPAKICSASFDRRRGSGSTTTIPRWMGGRMRLSSNLFFDVFNEYDPENLLLKQARREVMERQLEQTRLIAVLKRIQQCEIVIREVTRPTPLAFPLIVDRLRDRLSSEQLADRIARMQKSLQKAV